MLYVHFYIYIFIIYSFCCYNITIIFVCVIIKLIIIRGVVLFQIESFSTQHKSVVFSYYNNKLIFVCCVNTHNYSNNKIKNLIKQSLTCWCLTNNKMFWLLDSKYAFYKDGVNPYDDYVNNVQSFVVAKFFTEDEALMFESFCIRKFSPMLNTNVNFIDDLVFVKNERFVGDEDKYDIKYSHINTGYEHVGLEHKIVIPCLLIDLEYPIKLVSDVTGVTVQEIDSMLYRLEEYSNNLLPYEYISYDNRVLVDKRLLRHFRMLFKSVVESVDTKYSVLSDY